VRVVYLLRGGGGMGTELLGMRLITEMERNMIRHEITISKNGYGGEYTLSTVNRDLKKHREGGLPARRWWHFNGTLRGEVYYLNGLQHREGGLPAVRAWCWNGTLWYDQYYRNGEEYDKT
jgi:hypothetical protein